MDVTELVTKLNTLQRYSHEDISRPWFYPDYQLVEDNPGGEWIKAEDLANLFRIKFGHVWAEGDKFYNDTN